MFAGILFFVALAFFVRWEIKKHHEAKVLPFVAGQTQAYWSETEGKYRTPVASYAEETGRLITRRRSEAPTNKEYAVAEVRCTSSTPISSRAVS